MVSFEEFKKIEIKIAEVIEVKNHPNADKLYLIRIKLADEEREIVAGLKEHYTKEELLGKQVVVVINLEPATIRGIESRGMLLAASDANLISILTVDKPISTGSRVS
jgi:methionyl-tRNA synthetase